MTHRCLNCGKPITYQFAICSACERIFGRQSLLWPEWLRFMWRDILRERRQNKRVREHELEFAEL
jgi:hypothetical protein